MLINGNHVTVEDAAEIIGCTDARVRQLLAAKRIEGKKIGGKVWLVSEESAKKYRDSDLPPGRPRISA